MRHATTLSAWMIVLSAVACGMPDDEPARGVPFGADRIGAPESGHQASASSDPSSSAPSASSSPQTGSPDDAGVTSDAATDAKAAETSTPAPGAPALPLANANVIAAAKSAALSSYHRNASTGDIWCLPCDGAPVVLAASALAGDTTVDARLLEQIRHVIGGGNDPFATGGYSANDERNVTAMFALAKRTPRVWSKLTAAEIERIDLVMTAALVADVYLTADATNANGVPAGFDGSTNHDRDWNPNYREGMIGAVIVGTEYFGGAAGANAVLTAYDHAAFVTALQSKGLTNALWTFGTYQREPAKGAPSPATVKQGITNYAMHGKTLAQLVELYVDLANDTFSKNVACGLNAGAGVDVGGVAAGTIVTDCAGLPNVGAMGMQKEFDSVDAEGKRSSAGYVRLGVRAHLFNQLVLVAYGHFPKTTATTAALARVKVGVTDFFYKATKGYRGYSHAQDEGVFACSTDMDCTLNEAIWTQILAPAHGL